MIAVYTGCKHCVIIRNTFYIYLSYVIDDIQTFIFYTFILGTELAWMPFFVFSSFEACDVPQIFHIWFHGSFITTNFTCNVPAGYRQRRLKHDLNLTFQGRFYVVSISDLIWITISFWQLLLIRKLTFL